MGSSKSSRGAPGWASPNQPGNIANAKSRYSKGSPNTAEGTHMSGSESMRSGMKSGARNKSSSSKSSVKNSGPYGRS